jgi:glucose-6-phosphate 1-dehydrogenase
MASEKPHTVELGNAHNATHMPPCVLVIFGGAGDLSHRKLLPALYNLGVDDGLPEQLAILAFSMEELDDDGYRKWARAGIEKFSRRPLDEDHWKKFAPLLHFARGRFDQAEDFKRLKSRADELGKEAGAGDNRVFYFAIPPGFIDACSEGLSNAGMIHSPEDHAAFTRVVVEKPIGHDLDSALEIINRLARYFHESQTFRIDHYLGKETVENLMVLRFANAIFEPLWNARFIDHVQITVAETEGVGTRADYYEHAGALRDMVQSHLLQVLTMIAMEPPRTTGADAVRDAKLEVLRSLRAPDAEEIARWVVRGQYGQGLVDGDKVKGYREEDHIAPDSTVETFVALKCYVENWRWAGVPFYLRTGKRLPKRASEIAIQFNSVPRVLYNAKAHPPLEANQLTIRIQPHEGLSVHIVSKVPGAHLRLAPVKVDFHYLAESPEAYETLLRDVMAGDQTLFMRRDTVESAWRFVQRILDAWESEPTEPYVYSAGSWGPLESALMIAADGRAWRTL